MAEMSGDFQNTFRPVGEQLEQHPESLGQFILNTSLLACACERKCNAVLLA